MVQPGTFERVPEQADNHIGKSDIRVATRPPARRLLPANCKLAVALGGHGLCVAVPTLG